MQFANARTALYVGLILKKFKSNDKILVPDFICNEFLEPIKILGLKIIFYPISSNLTPIWPDLTRLALSENCAAIVMVHYFGQPQNIPRFIKLAEDANLLLIEDNAHGYGGCYLGERLGDFGDIGIDSPRKIIGTVNGGMLSIKNDQIDYSFIKLKPYPLYRPIYFLRASIFQFYFFKNFVKKFILKIIVKDIKNKNLNPSYTGILIDPFSLLKIKFSNLNLIKIKRKSSWKIWARFATQNQMQPILELSDESCPWALPVYVESLDLRNYWIEWGKKNDINLFQWPKVLPDNLPLESNAFSIWSRMICFPLEVIPNITMLKNENITFS